MFSVSIRKDEHPEAFHWTLGFLAALVPNSHKGKLLCLGFCWTPVLLLLTHHLTTSSTQTPCSFGGNAVPG